jgi:CII-binding regulator of phage lambda lysogenization HflD
MKLITDTEVTETIIQKYFKEEKGVSDSKQALISLPKIIEIMEKEYKALLGTSKKELVIGLIVCLMKLGNADEVEINLVKLMLPDLIDNFVDVLNSAGKLFRKKTKKCCVRIKN